jgi:acyl-CoA reductase-like NAD-dependent aldehyde dehydrogenase
MRRAQEVREAIGREGGKYGLELYTQIKTVYVKL